jgi:hypothetical protein
MNVLELFAGSRSIGKVCDKLNYNVFSSDINAFDKIDYVTDINSFDVLKVPFTPDIIWASPPCTYFSVASIGKHWNKNNTPKSDNALKGIKYVDSTLKIINYFLNINPKLFFYIENPRGKLRKLDVLKGIPRTTVWYCKYGSKNAKPTDVWSNNIYNPLFNPKGWKARPKCFNGNIKCHHEVAPRGARTGTQGLKDNYNRSKIPYLLCEEILKNKTNE